MRTRTLCSALAVLALAGCGDEPAERPASATELQVVVNGKSRTVTDAGGVTVKDLAPVPPTRACTEIYGGDATATVTGRLDGTQVDASFSLVNGCEIARWEDNATLLGDPPTGP